MKKSDSPFNRDEDIAHVKVGKPSDAKDTLLTLLIKPLTEASL